MDLDQSIYDHIDPQKREEDASKALMIRSEHTLRSENLPFDIDVWYPLIEKFTFPSIFIPLKRCEARAFINMYNTGCLHRHWLRPIDVDVLNDLENRLDVIIKQYFPEGAFLRLCGRSPKDSDPLHPEAVLNKYRTELASLLSIGYPDCPNTKFIAFIRTNWMKVNNGKEAMSLLVTSERVHIDMDDWLRYGEPEQIVLRKWEPDLSMENEFRCFVYQSKLNAISQYDHYGFFPHLPALKQRIQEKLLEKWKEVHPFIGEESYVIDFAYLQRRDEVVVVELSPFLTCTGPACFRWSNEVDKKILENGPLEFRLNSESRVTNGLIDSGVEDRFKGGQMKYYWWYKTVSFPLKRQAKPYVIGTVVLCLYLSLMMKDDYYLLFLSMLTTVGTFWALWKYFNRKIVPPKKNYLFFYGTLKRGFHWNKKYLSHSEFVTTATTCDPLPVVVGECGVPYLLGNRPGKGKRVQGEIWRVDDETLEGLDEYEGLRKGYYSRRTIRVLTHPMNSVMQVDAYFKSNAAEDEFVDAEYLECYTMEFHKAHYQPIRHIQVKQRAYLGIGYDIKT